MINNTFFMYLNKRMIALLEENNLVKNMLIEAGIKPCQIVNIEFVDLCDGGCSLTT